MSIAESLLPEFDHEMATTRAILERVPAEYAAWRPHPKSWPMGTLAIHLSNLPTWGTATLTKEELDLDPVEGPRLESPKFETTEKMMKTFDENVKAAREALASTSDEAMMGLWTLKNHGEKVFSMPRVAVFRSFVISHMIHHRAQLGVYLRMNDVPLPSVYGPTADMEAQQPAQA